MSGFASFVKISAKLKKVKKKISSPPFEKVKTAFLAWRQKKWKLFASHGLTLQKVCAKS
jgi:hypothetical protein